MATDMHLSVLEKGIGYHFSDRAWLELALTAAGAEEDNHEGNRRLAQVGDTVIPLAIAVGGLEKAAAPNKVNDMKAFLSDKAYRTRAAEQSNIAAFIKLCPRSRGEASKTVSLLALSAIIGAAYKDSNDLNVVARIIKNLNLLCSNDSVIDPLVLQNENAFPDNTGSACKELIEGDWERPPPIPKKKGQRGKEVDVNMIGTDQVWCFSTESSAYSASGNDIALPTLAHDDTDLFFNGFSMQDHTTSASLREDLEGQAPYGEGSSSSAQDMFEIDDLQSNPLPTEQQQNEIADTAATRQSNLPATSRKKSQQSLKTGDHTTLLNSYMEIEAARCRNHGHDVPQNTFLTPARIRDLSGCSPNSMENLQKLYIGVCSSEAIAMLRESIISFRIESNAQLPPPMQRMSISERFAVIERIGQRKAYLALTERLHLIKLYEDQSKMTDQHYGWIHLDGPEQSRSKTAGNPRHFVKAATTKALLKEIFPSLTENAEEYKSKYEKVKRMRKLGERLHLLKSRFSLGVIGLIPCGEFEVTKGISLNVSNRALLAPTDTEFKQFVDLLHQTQGKCITKWSEKVTPILDCVSRGSFQDVPSFPIECLEEHSILQLPKYSKELFSLISQ